MSTSRTDDGFFGSLFDLSFTSFVTTKLIKVLYVLAIIATGVWALALIVSGFVQGGAAAFFALLGGILGFFLGVVYVRVLLELVIVIFRIGEHTESIATTLHARDTPSWPSSAPPVAPQPPPVPPAQPSPGPPAQPSPGWQPPPAPRAGDDPTRRLPSDPSPDEPLADERPTDRRDGPGSVPPPPT